jgi:hypothetical protein
MAAEGAATDGVREILIVLGLALAGLLLTAFAVFAPWYPDTTSAPTPAVVELRAPVLRPDAG